MHVLAGYLFTLSAAPHSSAQSRFSSLSVGPHLYLSLCRARNRHYSLATYILLRGITLLIRVGNKERTKRRHPVLHAALAPTRTQHGDTLLMCAACELQRLQRRV